MGDCVALRETHFDPLPFLAQDYKACLCSSWLMLRCQESVEVKNPKGGWEETFLCLLTDFDLQQMLCQKEAGSPPCAGTVSRLRKVQKFQPFQSVVQLYFQGMEALKCESLFFWNVQNVSLPPQAHHECPRPWCVRVCCCAGTLSLLPLAPQLASWEDHPHQDFGSQPKSLLITVFSAGTEFTFLNVA